jgi:23S rRNA (uracil1939-C5)-methyltransferase
MEFENIESRKTQTAKREAIIKIEKYAGEGVSLGYDNDKAVFVRYAIPGETVKVNIYREAKDYAIGEPIEIIENSPDRIEPECPYFGFCGGCDYQMLSYEKQLEIKEKLVLETFERIGKLKLDKLTGIIPSPKAYHYRNTVTFKVNPRKQLIGFFRKDTKFIVDIDQCLIAMQNINRALNDIRVQRIFPSHNFKVRTTLDEDTVVNWVPAEDYEDRAVYETVTAMGNSFKFKISKDSFFQVNDYVIPRWIEKIIEFLDETHSERIFDLYCGIGLITLFVSHFARETIGVEISRPSIKDAHHNLKINDIKTNTQFVLGDVFEALPKLGDADVFIIDPPRKGMDRAVVDFVLSCAPKKIIYSSCKPASLARDINLLSSTYELKETVLVDMFPQTHHIEMVNLLVRK